MKCKPCNILFRILLVLYIGIIAYLCFAHVESAPKVTTIAGLPADKVMHFCMFFPLPVIGHMAYGKKADNMAEAVKILLYLASFSCIFAGITEIVQGSLAYRSYDMLDFMVDCMSVCVSGLMMFLIDTVTLLKRRA